MAPVIRNDPTRHIRSDRISRSSQHIATAFITSGLIFMLLPGTFLGVWNLISISHTHGPNSVAPAWLQAHGHAQLFGWVGSFIIGIGFYSLTKVQSTLNFPTRAGWSAWILWTLGISLRWCAGVALWHWRLLLPMSAALELVAFGLFVRSVRRHRPKRPDSSPEAWMRIVMAGHCQLLDRTHHKSRHDRLCSALRRYTGITPRARSAACLVFCLGNSCANDLGI